MSRRRFRPSPPSAVEPEIRDRIDRLALSWPVRQVRGEVRITPLDPCPDDWELRHEETYGDGVDAAQRFELYRHRRDELLMDVLLSKRVDHAAVIDVLEQIRRAELQHQMDLRGREWLRAFNARRESRRAELKTFYRAQCADPALAAELLEAHMRREPGAFFPSGDHRLEKKPAKPWIAAGRAELRRLFRFTLDDSNKLLMGIGVFRSRPTRVKNPR
jgi:hypothetical protein